MVLIEVSKSYEKYFQELVDMDDADVVMSYFKNFSGGNEIVEAVVTLTPVILPVVAKVLKTVLHHMQEMKRIDKENRDVLKITVKKSDFEVEVIANLSDINSDTNVEEIVEEIVEKLGISGN